MAPRKTSTSIEPGIRRIVLPSGKERFRVQIKRGIRRTSHLCETYQEAKGLKDDWLLRGLPARGAPPISSKHNVVATVDDGFRHRALDLEQRGKESGVTERIRVFLTKNWPAGAALPLSHVAVEHVEQYRDRRLGAGCKENTVVRELREWRAMLKKARPDFKLPDAIFPAENMTRVRHLTPRQYARVFKRLAEDRGPVLADLAELALLGVMRQADVRLLKRSYVRVTERVLLLPHTKGGPRTVRLSPQALVIVKRAVARKPRHDYVFANPVNGTPYSRVHVSRCWRLAARASGLQDFTFHDLRHHGPTLAVNNGANEAVLQALGGWKSPKMVKRYAHVLTPELDRYLSLIGNGKRRER